MVFKKGNKYGKMNRGKLIGDKNPAKRPEVREKISKSKKIYWKNPENRKRASYQKMGYKNPMKNPIHAKKMGNTKRGKKYPKIKEYWKHNKEDQLRKMMRGVKKQTPNNLEKEIIEIINNIKLPYKFVGNWKVIIGGKNPDFININGEKKVIEVFGDYWHKKRVRCYEETEKGRIEHFKKYGFKCLILWEHDINNKALIVEKLNNFNEV